MRSGAARLRLSARGPERHRGLGITPAHPIEVLRDAYGLAPALPAAENVPPGGAEARCGRRHAPAAGVKVAHMTRIVRHIMPLGFRVLVRVIPETDKRGKRIYLPQGAKERTQEALFGEVIEVARAPSSPRTTRKTASA